ncbi:hypothetical protein BV20DRAFT_602376 [Pilatotrama ljubarskyi]|nr:hypothetical protein BV20DRAFT_602376 [Pilatotrama ljubarskyi]
MGLALCTVSTWPHKGVDEAGRSMASEDHASPGTVSRLLQIFCCSGSQRSAPSTPINENCSNLVWLGQRPRVVDGACCGIACVGNLRAIELLRKPLSDPKDILATFTPELQTKLLLQLLADPATSRKVGRTMEGMYDDVASALVSSIRTKLAHALRSLQPRRTKKGTDADTTDTPVTANDMNDYVRVVQPLLADIARLARMPQRGVACAAFLLLLDVVYATDPIPESSDEEGYTTNSPEDRVPFDTLADAMLVVIAQRRMAEEGTGFVFAEHLQELVVRARIMEMDFGFEGWFARSIALLRWYAAERAKAALAAADIALIKSWQASRSN